MANLRIIETHPGLGGLLRRLVGSVDHLGQGTEFELAEIGPYILIEDASGIEGPDQPPFGAHPHCGLTAVSWIPAGGTWRSPTNALDSTELSVNAGEVLVTCAGRGVVHDERTASEGTHELIQIILRLPQARRGDAAWLRKHSAQRIDEHTVRVFDPEALSGTDIDATAYHVTLGADEETALDIPDRYVGFAYVRRGTARVDGLEIEEGALAVLRPDHGTLHLDAVTEAQVFVGLGAPIDEPWAKLLGNEGFVVAADADGAAAKMAEFEGDPERFGHD